MFNINPSVNLIVVPKVYAYLVDIPDLYWHYYFMNITVDARVKLLTMGVTLVPSTVEEISFAATKSRNYLFYSCELHADKINEVATGSTLMSLVELCEGRRNFSLLPPEDLDRPILDLLSIAVMEQHYQLRNPTKRAANNFIRAARFVTGICQRYLK